MIGGDLTRCSSCKNRNIRFILSRSVAELMSGGTPADKQTGQAKGLRTGLVRAFYRASPRAGKFGRSRPNRGLSIAPLVVCPKEGKTRRPVRPRQWVRADVRGAAIRNVYQNAYMVGSYEMVEGKGSVESAPRNFANLRDAILSNAAERGRPRPTTSDLRRHLPGTPET